MSLPRIAARIFNAPLLYDEAKAVAFLAGLGGRIVDGGVVLANAMPAIDHVAFENGRPSLGKVGDRLGRAYDARGIVPFDMVGNVAVIAVEGTLVHKGAFVGSASGETSYQGLQAQVTRAQRSEAVKGVVFEIDSFGGEAAGAFQTADMIARLSAVKPTLAILTDNALSAGYLLAAPARQIVMPAEGRTGSIGVLRMLVDARGKLEKDGLKVTLITSGKHKADGHPATEASEELLARMKVEADAMRVTFADSIGRYRGQRFTSAQALATEAQHYGAEDSIRLGLADAVGDSHEAFAEFVDAINRKG